MNVKAWFLRLKGALTPPLSISLKWSLILVLYSIALLIIGQGIGQFDVYFGSHPWLKYLFIILLGTLAAILVSSIFSRPILAIKYFLDEVNTENMQNKRLVLNQHEGDELSQISSEINQMLDQLSDYVDQQIRFIEDASHELRTPVAIVLGHLNLLERWGKEDPEQLEESLHASISEMQRMKSLVSEMSDLSRAGQLEDKPINGQTEITEVTQATIENMRMIHQDFTIRLDNEIDEPCYLGISRHHFEQILVILLDNAVKYSLDSKFIFVSLGKDENGYAEVAVQDFGEGISEEDQKRVFDRFYRVDKARSRERGGNGLGLSIAQRLVEKFDGSIFVESSLGNGSIFHVRMPILPPDKNIVSD